MPARGRALRELENVPIRSNGIPKPKPNAKSSIKPRSLLTSAVTILKSKMSPGERHGDATLPLIMPKRKIESREPL